jgi:hypothetical protein
MPKNIVITACNSRGPFNNRNYFTGVMTLISSIHQYSFDVCDGIYVYNLGLRDSEKNTLNRIRKVQVEEYPNYLSDEKYTYKEYMDPRYHGYKCFSMFSSGHRLASPGDNILWLDSGVCAVQDIKCIFDIINRDHIFMVGDVHKNYEFTSDACSKLMNATEEEMNSNQLSSGILGYKVQGNYQIVIDMALNYSFNRDAIYSALPNHRHDQSIYSILAKRFNCPQQSLQKYGEYGGYKCNDEQVIYVHRCSYINNCHIRYK